MPNCHISHSGEDLSLFGFVAYSFIPNKKRVNREADALSMNEAVS
jgi:hypothetical protein